MIEAVLFDGDQTLWDFQRVMREALIAVAGEMRTAWPGRFTNALRWQDLEHDRDVVGEELAGVEYNLARLRVLGFVRTLRRLHETEGGVVDDQDDSDDAALAQQLATSYFDHRDRDPALFADTLPCLDALRSRFRLGLLSNGSRPPETVGLGGYFETVVFAQDHRVAKPDKRIFEIVERELAISARGCVLVGDHPDNDVVGAKRAGWYAVWLDRDGEGDYVPPVGSEERPDAIVTSLAELPEILGHLDGALGAL